MKLPLTLLVILAVYRGVQVNGVPLSDKQQKTTINHAILSQELDDFISILPMRKIQQILYTYVTSDNDFNNNLIYVLSNEFQSEVTKIASVPEVRDLLTDLEEYNELLRMFFDKIMNKIQDEESYHRLTPSNEVSSNGLAGFVKEILTALPLDKIEKLYRKKMVISKHFSTLVQRLKSQELKKKLNKLIINTDVQNFIYHIEQKDLNTEIIFDLFTSVLGIQFPNRSVDLSTRKHNLKDDLNDFMALIPREKIRELFYEYLSDDEDFGEALDYVLSEEFTSLIKEVEGMTEVKNLLKFLQDSGLDAYGFINKINEILGIGKIVPPNFYRAVRITGGLPGFIKDVKALLPTDKIEKLYKEKLKTSEDFAKLIERLESKEFQGLVDTLMSNPKLQDLMKRAEAKGVDVQAILDFISSVLGLKFPHRPGVLANRNLKDDLNDFLALIPREKIQDLFYEYLSDDEDFGEALDYVLSEEFTSLITEVEGMTEVKNLLKFLQDSGLNAYGFINKINEILGIGKLVPPNYLKSTRISGGLPGFIQDIKALLPTDKIEKLYKEKLTTSKDFAKLIERLQSKEFQELVDTVMANPKLQNLIKRAEAKGVDVQAILDFISSVLGLKFPHRPGVLANRNLKDDLNDFLALIPREKIRELFYEYLSDDEDFGEALDYVLSEEFTSLIKEVEGMTEVKNLLKFLQDSGLNAYGFINKINEILGIDKVVPPKYFKSSRISGGLPGFIQDIKALLPTDKIEKLYKEKLTTSKDFAKLIERLQSKEFQELVDTLMANPKLQDLMKRAEAKGVDVQAILDFISSVLGLKFPHRPGFFKEEEVMDILHVLWSKIPLDNILDTVIDYIVQDDDIQKVTRYIISDEFKETLMDIEELSDIKLLLKYLDETGLNVYAWINSFHEIIGLEKTLPLKITHRKITGGIPGLMHDIRSQLPLDELHNYYDEKLVTSNKFRDFINRLREKELQNSVDALHDHQGFNVLLDKLEALGVDWDEVIEIISAILGIKFPDRPF